MRLLNLHQPKQFVNNFRQTTFSRLSKRSFHYRLLGQCYSKLLTSSCVFLVSLTASNNFRRLSKTSKESNNKQSFVRFLRLFLNTYHPCRFPFRRSGTCCSQTSSHPSPRKKNRKFELLQKFELFQKFEKSEIFKINMYIDIFFAETPWIAGTHSRVVWAAREGQ